MNSTSLFSTYLWAISHLFKYRFRLIIYIATILVVSGAELAIPKAIQHLITNIVPENNKIAFAKFIIFVLVTLTIMISAKVLQNATQQMLVETASHDMKINLFGHIRKLGFSYYEKNSVGKTLSLFHTEAEAVDKIYRLYVPYTLKESLFSIICIIVMVSIHLKLTLITFPGLISYYFLGPYFAKKASLSGEELVKNQVSLNKKIYDSLSAIIELRATGKEKWDAERINHEHQNLNNSFIRNSIYSFARGAVRRFSIYAGAIAIFIYGAYLVKSNLITTGEFIAFSIIYFMAVDHITLLIIDLTEQKLLLFQAQRIRQIMNMKPEVKEATEPQFILQQRGEIEIRNVHFSYTKEEEIINGISLHIMPGEKVALVGLSGCGKTTILKLLGRFYDVTKGEIIFDHVPIRDLSFKELRGMVGYVLQENYLFGTSIRENIRFGKPEATDQEVISAAKAANAHDFIMNLPEQYDTFVGERGVKLSGGQKQRIAIARMLIKNPIIVALDEATSALDNISELEVKNALESLFSNRTIICIAHKLATIQHFDKIVVIDKGKIIEEGNFDCLMSKQGLFYKLWKGNQEAENERNEVKL